MRQKWLLKALALSAFALLASPVIAASQKDLTECLSSNYGKRIAACTAVIADPATPLYDRLLALDARSFDLAMAGRYPEAMVDIDQSLKLDPDSALALNARAWTLFKWKRSAEGLADVNRALQLNPSSAPAWDTRAHLYQVLGKFDLAFKDYEAAIGFGGESFIRSYQCGLRAEGLYKGPVNGIYSVEMRAALKTCASVARCDPLPENEFETECEANTS